MKNEKNEDRIINYEFIIELRGRAELTKQLREKNSEEKKEIFEINKIFVKIINQI